MSTHRIGTDNRELDELFERYRLSPEGHVFAPLADACRKAGMIDEALEICAKGVALHPRYAIGWVVRGKCLFDAGRAGEAESAFRRVLDVDRNNLVALKYLGVIHAGRGELARARDHFEHILALDPDNREIRALVEEVKDAPSVSGRDLAGEIPAEVSEPADAPEDLDEIEDESFEGEPITLRDESVTPDEIATMTLADIYAAQGYVAKALKIYREVYQRQPGDALRAKIDALETRREPVATPVELTDDAPAPEKEAAAPAPSASTTPAHAEPAEEPVPAMESRAVAPPSRPGPPVAETRNYEQFKRWLKGMSG